MKIVKALAYAIQNESKGPIELITVPQQDGTYRFRLYREKEKVDVDITSEKGYPTKEIAEQKGKTLVRLILGTPLKNFNEPKNFRL